MDINQIREAYIGVSNKSNRQRKEIDRMREIIEQLKEENKELREYKKAYYASTKAGVDMPHVKLR